MTNYKYKAISISGEKISGVIEAYSEFDVADQIRSQYPIIESITPIKRKKFELRLNDPLTLSEKGLSLVCKQFSILMEAGIPLVRVMEIIAEQTKDMLIKRIFTLTAQDVEAGHALGDSFERNGKKLPLTFIETIRAGEESGTLEQSLRRLADYYKKSYKIKQKVRSAMMYPAFMLVLAGIVIAIVMMTLVPVMIDSFLSQDVELPGITLVLIVISEFFQTKWMHMIVSITLLTLLFLWYKKTEKGIINIAKLALKIPVLGKIAQMNAASQFANTMATLLASGLSTTRCLSIMGKVMDNRAIALSMSAIVPKIEEGKRIGEAMVDNPYLPKMLIEMTSIGEESGSLEDTLVVIGGYYDNEAEESSNRALAMLEPIITVILGVMVAFIVGAIYLPMFSMYG